MCGDTYCWSCGPAQGNHKCPNCGRWSLDGPCDDPAACEKACKEQAEAEQREFEKHAEEEERYFAEMEAHGPSITVNCPTCGRMDEQDVEFLDISEGLMGEDRLKFRCPTCHEIRESVRLG